MMVEDSEKPDAAAPSAGEEPPEVDAEIVTSDDVATSSAENNDGFSSDDEALSNAYPPKKAKLNLRAIILSAGGVAVLGVGFALWRLLTPGAQPVLSTDALSEEVEEQSVERLETTPDEPAPTPEQAGSPSDVNSKITNDIETTASETDLEAPDDGSLTGGAFLPPLPSTEKIETGNEELQEAAKEALKQSESLGEKEESSAITLDKEQNDAPVFELESVDGPPLDDLQTDAPELETASDAAADLIEITDIEAAEAIASDVTTDLMPEDAASSALSDQDIAKIDNDIEAIKEGFRAEIADLKASLAEERERDATQRAEYETMRRDFLEALAARDEKANAEIAALTSRLDKIQNDDGIAAGRRAAATIALGALQRVIETGEPYAKELNVLAGYAPNASELTILRRYADTGAPTISDLKSEFATVARMALAASGRDEATNFWGKLASRAGSVISLRPATPTTGDSARAIVSRAEGHINNGRISACIIELDNLAPQARDAIGGWIEKAQARSELDEAIAALYTRFTTPIK